MKKESWIDGQRPRDGHPLPLTAGQLVRSTIPDTGKLDESEQFVGSGAAGRTTEAPNLQRIGDVLRHGGVRKQRKRLKHHAESAPVGGNCRLVDSIDQYLAGDRQRQPRDEAQKRGPPAPGRAEQADQLAVRNVDVDIVDRRNLAESLGETPDAKAGSRYGPVGKG